VAERTQAAGAPTEFFVADLPARCPVARLARLAKTSTRAAANIHHATSRLGLTHYEGRNWLGWHHHVALVSVAHAFLTVAEVRAGAGWAVCVEESATGG
jgi:SRSO17 transposase